MGGGRELLPERATAADYAPAPALAPLAPTRRGRAWAGDPAVSILSAAVTRVPARRAVMTRHSVQARFATATRLCERCGAQAPACPAGAARPPGVVLGHRRTRPATARRDTHAAPCPATARRALDALSASASP